MFKGMCETRRLEGVVEYCDRLVERDPRNAEPLLALAELYRHHGRNEDAIATLRHAMSIDDRTPAIYERLRQMEAEAKEERYFELKGLLEKDTDNRDLHVEMGDIYMERGENIQAVKHFQVAARDPRLRNLCSAKQAACLAYRRLYDLAEEQLNNVILDPVGDPNVREIKRLLYSIAATYETDKLMAQAFSVYKRIFRVDAGYRDVARRIEEMS
jgi:tetratricopeptide (TPR) repeat protein